MQNTEQSNISTLDIKKMIFRILAHWYLFVIFMGGAYAIVTYKNKFVTPKYSIHSTILVSSGQSQSKEALGRFRLFSSRKNLQNEMGMLQSYSFNRKTIEKLDFLVSYYKKGRYVNKQIYKSSPFVMNVDTTHSQRRYTPVYIKLLSETKYKIVKIGENPVDKTMYFGEQYETSRFSFSIDLREGVRAERYTGNTYYCKINTINRLTKKYKNKLRIDLLNESGSILWLWMDGRNPEKDADFLNKLIEVYKSENLKEKTQKAKNTIDFIDSQISSVEDSLTQAQNNLQQFRMNNELIKPDKQEEGGIYEKLDEFQQQKNENTLKIRYLNHLLEQIKQDKNLKSVTPPSAIGIENSVLLNLITELRELYQKKEIRNFSIKKEDLPSMEVLNYQIQKAREALVENIENTKSALQLKIDKAQEKIDNIMAKLRGLPRKERKMRNLQRKFNINDNLYTYLLEKRAEAGITLASSASDIKVLDKARAKNASRKKADRTNPALGLLLGFFIPLVFIVVKDYFSTTIADRKDVEDNTFIPILGSVAHNNKETGIPSFEYPRSGISESFRALRTNLQYLLFDTDTRVISVTSTVSGEGKTFCAVNLAAIVAMSNNKTLVMGMDMRKSRLHDYFDVDNSSGVSNYLIGKYNLEDVIQESHIDNLYALPAGPIPPNPAELLESKRVNTIYESLRNTFDYIFIDTPPVAMVTDALLISRFTDANVFVIRQDYSNKNVLKLVNELYNNKNVTNLSIIINDVKVSGNYGVQYAYKYGYRHGIGHGYGSYYSYGYYEDSSEPQSLWKRIGKIFKRKKT